MITTAPTLSIADYDQLIETGAFDAEHAARVELIEGVITAMSPIGPGHDEAVSQLMEWTFAQIVGQPIRHRIQQAISLPMTTSVPQPDVAWVTKKPYGKYRPQASDVLLVIEVADSSLAYDLGPRARLYAEANIREYWVVNLPDRRLEIFRDPQAGSFRDRQVVSHPGQISPLVLPTAVLATSLLFDG